MRTQPLVVLALLLGVVVAPQAQAGCTHLMVDPAGDVTELRPPSDVDSTDQIDLSWLELSSSKTRLVATFKVADLNPESEPVLDHSYRVSFSNGGQRFALSAGINRAGNWAYVSHRVAGEDPAPADEYDPSSANEIIGDATSVVDARRDTVTVTADLSIFDEVHRLSGNLTLVRAITASGASAVAFSGYSVDDHGHTSKAYRLGARSCTA